MQFTVIARDGTDGEAAARRQKVRAQHLENMITYKANMLMGAATLDAQGQMVGSVMIVDFPSRAAVDAWLETEPYVTGNVWQDISIEPCQVGPSFL